MTERFLAGYNLNLGKMGIWLSRAGVNVLTATAESDFLLSSDYQNAQVIMTGIVSLAPGTNTTVMLPYPVSGKPFVSFHESVDATNLYYPYKPTLRPEGAVYTIVVDTYTDRIVPFNGTIYTIVVRYSVLNKII